MIKKVLISKVKPDLNQPRKIFNPSYISGLAKSLEIEGMINPIEVDQNLIIITGECRWRAAKEAGWKEVPVKINRSKLPPYERFRRQLAENLHQSSAGGSAPMNAIDVAKAYKKLIKMRTGKDYEPGSQSRGEIYGMIKEVAKELGVTRRTVYEYVSLLSQPKYVIEDIEKGKARTLYRRINAAPEKFKKPLRKAVLEGHITNRKQIRRIKKLARISPKSAEIELLRVTKKQSEEANRILNRAIELSLALRTDPSLFSPIDKEMITKQLGSTMGSIRNFFGYLKGTKPYPQNR